MKSVWLIEWNYSAATSVKGVAGWAVCDWIGYHFDTLEAAEEFRLDQSKPHYFRCAECRRVENENPA